LCQEYLKGRLEKIGFATDLWDPDGPALYEKYKGRPGAHKGRTFEGRPNLGGTLKGQGGGRSIFLTGHIDVVPPGPPEHWRTDPFGAEIIDGFVQGRGAVDMKGGVACMLMAIEILRELEVPLRGDVIWGTVVDEEIGGMGALAMADRGYHADVGIMTEPTGNTIAPICRGILWARIIIDGIGGHAEMAPNSWDTTGPVDAIWLCRQMLDGIDILNRRWRYDPRKTHPLLKDAPCQIIATQIKAGEHPASMAGRAEIVIDVQYLPSEKDEFLLGGHVKREVEEHVAAICHADPYLRKHPARIEWILDAPVRRRHAGGSRRRGAFNQADGRRRPHRHGHSHRTRPHADAHFRTWRFGAGAPAQRARLHRRSRRLHARARADDRALVRVRISGATAWRARSRLPG
jgi:acetylornithine deacetylase